MPVLKMLGGLPKSDMVITGIGSAETAGGGELGNVQVRFREVDIGPWQMKNVSGAIVRNGDCLLGMSVLTRFGHPSIDFASQQLTLAD